MSQPFNTKLKLHMLKQSVAHLGLWLIIFSAMPNLSAEPTTKENAKKGRHFKVACLGEWSGGALFVSSAQKKPDTKKMIEVPIFDMSYSPSLPYKVGQPIQFFKKTESEKTPYKLALSVKIPENIKAPLVLLMSHDKKISYRVFELDPKAFPFGSWRMVNLSKKNLVAAMDKEVKPLPPGKEMIFHASGKKFVKSWVRIGSKDSKEIVFSTMIIRRDFKRVIVFLGGGRDTHGQATLNSRMLVDFKPTKEAAE